jgi:hypothetical protein
LKVNDSSPLAWWQIDGFLVSGFFLSVVVGVGIFGIGLGGVQISSQCSLKNLERKQTEAAKRGKLN